MYTAGKKHCQRTNFLLTRHLNEQFRASLLLVDDNGINVTVHPDQSTVEIINSKCNKKEVREMKAFCILLLYSSYYWVC